MLKDRWPNFLQEIYEFQQIADAEQPEFDLVTDAVDRLHEDFSIFTVSEIGAGRWEEILGLPRIAGESLTARRSRIQTKYLSQLPYTYRSLLQYLAQIGGVESVNLDAANYELYVDIRLSGYDQRTALLAVLTDMLPANILLRLRAIMAHAIDNAQIVPTAFAIQRITHKSHPQERGN